MFVYDINNNVTAAPLEVLPAPAGVTAVIGQQEAGGGYIVTVTVAPGTAIGAYALNIKVKNKNISKTVFILV